MKYKENWEETKAKFTGWWNQSNTGRPLMKVIARSPEIEGLTDGKPTDGGYDQVFCQGKYYNMPEELMWKDMEDKYMDPERMVLRYHSFCKNHIFLGESFPNMETHFGPGSTAAYLGSEVKFKEDTIWFEPCIDEDTDWEDVPELKFDPENKWLKKHLEVVKGCRKYAGDDFCLDMPDLMENVDVLSSLRGAQPLMMDMIEDPDSIAERVEQVTKAYFPIYDAFYDLVKGPEGGNSYSCFQIWAPGRMAKVQCDASAMMSTDFFNEFVWESLKQQTEKLDYAMYHLDGPGAIRHVDKLMEIPGIKALQWTPGDAGPDGTYEEWDKIYDKVVAAGKSLWVKVYSGDMDDWIRNCERLVKKYGSSRILFYYPEMSLTDAKRLLTYAEDNWCDIKGSFNE